MLGAGAAASGCDSDGDAQQPIPSNACETNDDCIDSKAAQDLEPIRCAAKEVYCSNRTCIGECRDVCAIVRDDTNPCPEPAHCARVGDSADAISYCTMRPIPCDDTEDCPQYRPQLDGGGQSDWTCDAGECSYPGVEYATR